MQPNQTIGDAVRDWLIVRSIGLSVIPLKQN
jgi:hypothetical protein